MGLIICIRGQKFGDNESPIEPLYEEIKKQFPDVSVEIIDHDMADLTIEFFEPLSQPIALVGHSFGFDTAVEIAGDLYGRHGPASGVETTLALVSLDGVKKREWWNPFVGEWKLSANVASALCFLRKGLTLIPPYHSKFDCSQNNPQEGVTYDYDNIDIEGDHNSMVASCSDQVIEFLKTVFPEEL